jgi:hypothetical protein
MNFIELPIYCHTDATTELKDLGIKSSMDDYSIRTGCINADRVQAFYESDAERVETILHVDGDTFSIALPYNKVKEVLNVKH